MRVRGDGEVLHRQFLPSHDVPGSLVAGLEGGQTGVFTARRAASPQPANDRPGEPDGHDGP
eukprot:2901213-Lingulodinium_polyedra.AAC.1